MLEETTVLVQVTVLTFSRVHFALLIDLMESPDREKPLKLVSNTNFKYLLSKKQLTTRALSPVTKCEMPSHAIQGFHRFLFAGHKIP